MLPIIIRILAVVGTIALLMVAGGIFVHYIDFAHHALPTWPDKIREFIMGFAGGTAAFILYMLVMLILKTIKGKPATNI